MVKNISRCIYANPDFCPTSPAFSRCKECRNLKYCCAHMNNCEPWHCSVYLDYLTYKEKYSNA